MGATRFERHVKRRATRLVTALLRVAERLNFRVRRPDAPSRSSCSRHSSRPAPKRTTSAATFAPAAVVELLATIDEAPPVQHTPLIEAIAAHYRGRLLALDGDFDEAEPMLHAAAARYEELDARFELARALLRLGELLAVGRPADAADPLEQARQIFASLGARPWLARIDAVGATAFV